MRIETDGVGLEVTIEGEGPPVVLLHGWPDTHELWAGQTAALSAAGYQVIAPDLRGLGASDKPEGVDAYNILLLAGDVLGVLDHLGIEKAHVVGHDWG
ncbi:MAG: alpha/beta fold hydrolase, partial [Acidimicrobiales bacterium]